MFHGWFADNTSRVEDYWCALFLSRAFAIESHGENAGPICFENHAGIADLGSHVNLWYSQMSASGSIILRQYWIRVTAFINFVICALKSKIHNFYLSSWEYLFTSCVKYDTNMPAKWPHLTIFVRESHRVYESLGRFRPPRLLKESSTNLFQLEHHRLNVCMRISLTTSNLGRVARKASVHSENRLVCYLTKIEWKYKNQLW